MSPETSPAAHAAELLTRSIARGRLGHAYLFVGDDAGILEEAAIRLSQSLTCSRNNAGDGTRPAAEPCGTCSACRRTASFQHPDVTWVRPGKKSRIISIDQIRDLNQMVSLRPTEARHKVGIITTTERLRIEAANAFLKTLEEPPRNSIFILLTLDADQVLETILSRCLRLSFAGGGVRIEPEVSEWLNGFTAGVAGSSSSLLDRYRLVESLLQALAATRESIDDALTAASPLKKYADADADRRERWEDELEAAIEAEYRRRRAHYLAGIHAWLRDVWLRTVEPAGTLFLPRFQEASSTIARRITSAAARANLDAWERTQRLLLGTNAQEALVLEVGLLRLSL
ncbi:MAG: DNA polymerase III subunit [Verrucomicrobiota bacterium]